MTEISEEEKILRDDVSHILRLAPLAPDMVEAMLAGRTDQAFMLEQLERPLPASWQKQRRAAQTMPGRMMQRKSGRPVPLLQQA